MTPQEFIDKNPELMKGSFGDVENLSIPAGRYKFVVGCPEPAFTPMVNGIPQMDRTTGKPVSIAMVRIFAFGETEAVGKDKPCTPIRIAQAAIAGAMGLQTGEEWKKAADNFTAYNVEKYLSEKRDPRDPSSRDKFKYAKY